MKLKDRTKQALEKWLGQPTWHTGHPLDRQRFYAFVFELREDLGGIDQIEPELIKLALEILRLGNSPWPEAEAEKELQEVFLKASTIISFLNYCKQRGAFPRRPRRKILFPAFE